MNLIELKKKAEAATPGRWKRDGRSVRVPFDSFAFAEAYVGTRANAEFVEAIDRDTVLRLVKVAERAMAVARSNGFDAALPDKMVALREALEGVNL